MKAAPGAGVRRVLAAAVVFFHLFSFRRTRPPAAPWVPVEAIEPPVFEPVRETLPEPALEPSPGSVIEPLPEPGLPTSAKPALSITNSSYLHIEDLLDAIPECRRLIKKLKKVDPDAYDYHSRLGARVLSRRGVVYGQRIDQKFIDTLPAAGMINVCDNRKTPDTAGPQFIYFSKVNAKMDFAGGPIDPVAFYRVTMVLFDLTRSDGTGKPLTIGGTFPVALDREGRITLLRETQHETIATRHAGHSRHVGDGSSIRIGTGKRRFRSKIAMDRGSSWTRRFSGYGRFIITWAREKNTTPQDLAETVFVLSANFYASSVADDFQIRAERDGMSVAFSVAIGRTPHIFKDRQTTVAKDGKRKRIFHAVAAHERILASGKVSSVKAHYRGERSFTWNGENITIARPERNLMMWNEPSVELEEGMVFTDDYLSLGEAAEHIRTYVDA